jgi:hypothetical protein
MLIAAAKQQGDLPPSGQSQSDRRSFGIDTLYHPAPFGGNSCRRQLYVDFVQIRDGYNILDAGGI